ncbi:hypothetical protein [Magnetofaba australis]|uniref:Uncharacterized protein n=1 Tax=Magnetofaba australis IT-1 TaxID=1434232 RepID=A0A1Y2K0Q2_9PROT|nr:hypothetical protein [Magnetofaba australis]OSM01623.1 hypothetical protein MAIT1_01634 [Magnetofaba australis IT-1]
MQKWLVMAALGVCLPFAAQAATPLDKEAAIKLFTDHTFDGVFVPKDKRFQAYEAPDGSHIVLRPNGKRDKGRVWSINDQGQHCTTSPKNADKLRCSSVLDMGGGVYHKVNAKGKHTHTLTNFRPGNQL